MRLVKLGELYLVNPEYITCVTITGSVLHKGKKTISISVAGQPNLDFLEGFDGYEEALKLIEELANFDPRYPSLRAIAPYARIKT